MSMEAFEELVREARMEAADPSIKVSRQECPKCVGQRKVS
jgi:hypothetical protein